MNAFKIAISIFAFSAGSTSHSVTVGAAPSGKSCLRLKAEADAQCSPPSLEEQAQVTASFGSAGDGILGSAQESQFSYVKVAQFTLSRFKNCSSKRSACEQACVGNSESNSEHRVAYLHCHNHLKDNEAELKRSALEAQNEASDSGRTLASMNADDSPTIQTVGMELGPLTGWKSGDTFFCAKDYGYDSLPMALDVSPATPVPVYGTRGGCP